MNRGWEGGRKGGTGGREAEREREKSGRKRRGQDHQQNQTKPKVLILDPLGSLFNKPL